jgi:hypothetical protein
MSLEEILLSSGAFLPLFTEGHRPYTGRIFGGGSTNADLDLYTSGYYGTAESLPLYTSGTGLSCSTSFPLYCFNAGVEGVLNLYTIGEGVNPNYYPANDTLDLYIKCAFGTVFDLYTHGGPQPSSNESLDLYVCGHQSTTGNLDLVIPNVYGSLTNSLNLFTSGF